MNHSTNRMAMLGALLAASLGGLASIPSRLLAPRSRFEGGTPSRRRTRAAHGEGTKKFWLNIGGKRVIFDQRKRPAAPFLPNHAGYRYQHGVCIPRDTQNPPKAKKQRAAKAVAAPAPLKRKYNPKQGERRFDRKGAERAARRAGVISARQQRRYNKVRRYVVKHDQAAPVAEVAPA